MGRPPASTHSLPANRRPKLTHPSAPQRPRGAFTVAQEWTQVRAHALAGGPGWGSPGTERGRLAPKSACLTHAQLCSQRRPPPRLGPLCSEHHQNCPGDRESPSLVHPGKRWALKVGGGWWSSCRGRWGQMGAGRLDFWAESLMGHGSHLKGCGSQAEWGTCGEGKIGRASC